MVVEPAGSGARPGIRTATLARTVPVNCMKRPSPSRGSRTSARAAWLGSIRRAVESDESATPASAGIASTASGSSLASRATESSATLVSSSATFARLASRSRVRSINSARRPSAALGARVRPWQPRGAASAIASTRVVVVRRLMVHPLVGASGRWPRGRSPSSPPKAI